MLVDPKLVHPSISGTGRGSFKIGVHHLRFLSYHIATPSPPQKKRREEGPCPSEPIGSRITTTHCDVLDVAPFGKGNVLPKILSNVLGPRVNIVVIWGMTVFLLQG